MNQLPPTKWDNLSFEKKKDGDGVYPIKYKSIIIQRKKEVKKESGGEKK